MRCEEKEPGRAKRKGRKGEGNTAMAHTNGNCCVGLMGGAAGTAGTAAAVPLLREVRQDKVLPYHILVKKIHKHIGDLVLLI